MSKETWAILGLFLILGIAGQSSHFSNALYNPQNPTHFQPVFGPMRPPLYMRPQPQPYRPEYPFQPPPIAPAPPRAPQAMLSDELACLVVNIYRESRGEPRLAQAMVAYVTINRTRYGDYFGGPSVCGVVFKEHQFSWTDTSLRAKWPQNTKSLQEVSSVAQWVISHGPPSGEYSEALFFANVGMMSSSAWCRFLENLVPIGTIGRLTFFRYPHPGERAPGCGRNRYAQG